MKRIKMDLILILLVAAILLAACTTPTPTQTSVPSEPPPQPTLPAELPTATSDVQPTESTSAEAPIYLSIIWHQHQPVYYKDPETGVYAKPWVRVHATKDYVDMAAMLELYPDIHATFNLTPSLIRQLDDLQAGAKDLYWVTAEIPADQLTADQKQFLLDRFFDTNRKIIARFPRYQELLDMRDGKQDYTNQDYLDLQVLFNLAWVDPDWLAQEPLKSLVDKGANFSEADKQVLFAEHQRLIAEVIPVHRALQDAGQIEVTMTPLTHPILPLLISTELAKEAMPDITLPGTRYTYGQDAVEQLRLGVELYEDHFGKPPRGMWPAEGSVAQEITTMVGNAGIQWMASDEGVLANSLGFPAFNRDGKEVVTEPDVLYRPYYVQGSKGSPVAMVFRDVVISDKVGFQYSGMQGASAAQDFVNRIHAIRDSLIESGNQEPHLVSVILDGENAWENYDLDGKEFLNTLYQLLSEDPAIKTVTPSEFLQIAPDQPKIDDLWAGSWINHDFSTWIGEDEENRAWEYLAETRAMLQKYISGTRQASSQEALNAALEQMYIAEGSDWFWWYGSDQNSGNDESFDQQFRDTLKQVYIVLGEQPPSTLDVPVIPLKSVSADQASTGLITPTVDGVEGEDEWAAAGVYQASGGAMAAAEPYFASLAYGFDAANLYLKVATVSELAASGESSLDIYLRVPGSDALSNFSRSGSLLGFPANRLIAVEFRDGALVGAIIHLAGEDETWQVEGAAVSSVAAGENLLEIAIPLVDIGKPEAFDKLSLRALANSVVVQDEKASVVTIDQLPASGPAELSVPDLGTSTIVLDIADPEKDDFGPGTYTYPKDQVFAAGAFDALNFQVGYDDENIIFKFTLRGPIENPWGSSNGLSVQTFDIYIDKDGDGQGGVAMLPGRNLVLQAGSAWDFAITAEGWESGIYTPGDQGAQKVATASQFTVQTDPGQQKVTIRVPKTILGDNPQDWRYAAVVLGQEGYPAGGVQRVRDVNPSAEQWRFGGAPADTNHTRVIDIIWPDAGQQETWLSTYTSVTTPQTELTAENFAQVGLLSVQQK